MAHKIFHFRRALPALLTTLLCMTLAQPAAAQWKWRDAQGRVQYSDRPPPNAVPERDILSRPAAARTGPGGNSPPASASPASGPAAAAPAASSASGSAEARRRATEEASRRAEEERQARQRSENCARARDYARTVESGQRIARTNDRGEREFLDDSQRAAELNRAREVIASDCR